MRPLLLLLSLIAVALLQSAAAREITAIDTKEPSPWGGDVALEIAGIECAESSKCTVAAKGTYEGKPVAVRILLKDTAGHTAQITFFSVGSESDALLSSLGKIYRLKPSSNQFKEAVAAPAVVLNGAIASLGTKKVSMKVFLDSGARNTYAELFVNIDPPNRTLELYEKDIEYRKNVLRALAK